jgi:predicted nucleotide-binding protein (sugar kinase/HSP70/actin superfamily)
MKNEHMVIGIPNGLLFYMYGDFARVFFSELGIEIILSPDTDKAILDAGIRSCESEACLPVKLFCGHVAWLCGRCDAILVPRLMRLTKRQSVCPMFCGLSELARNAAGGTRLIDTPLYAPETGGLDAWAKETARRTGASRRWPDALEAALGAHEERKAGFCESGYPFTVALIGHAYNIYDRFVNMDLIRKLHALGIGVITHERVAEDDIRRRLTALSKPPFWYFAQRYYGAALHLLKNGGVDGIIYVSAFGCGVDAVVEALIRDAAGGAAMMTLKLDEHTGAAGFDTRLEAFADMLQRRKQYGDNDAPAGEHAYGHAGAF